MSSRQKYFLASLVTGLPASAGIYIIMRYDWQGITLLILFIATIFISAFSVLSLIASFTKKPRKTFDVLANVIDHFFPQI